MICGILLAAGTASRFGSNKLLYPLPDGTPIGISAARNLKKSVDHVIAVVRPDDKVLTNLLHTEGVSTIVAENSGQGMSGSLVVAIRTTKDADGWLIALADMPWINPQTISTIAMMIEEGTDIAAPYYGEHRGHPVGFSHRFLPELLRLTDDKGAGELLRINSCFIRRFQSDDIGILQDVDRPRDVLTKSELISPC
ncbi:MAG: nucleotidyltransferase family protein [Gammaproteobacteria bacterium]|nr:nucleotidyltransferase family protein [Gammaproteobacteria bacterium]